MTTVTEKKNDASPKHQIAPLYRNKIFGICLLILGIFSVLVIVHRLAHYVYEFDPKYSPIDYGRFNFLSFFTVQSNLLVCFYLLVTAFAVFGNARAQKIAFHPVFGAFVTTYILITGVVYCCGIPLAFTTPYQWDTPSHSMLSFIQVYHHMIIPPLMLLLWFFPATKAKIPYKKAWLSAIYPLIYSALSIVRAAVLKPTFYVYPFYNPAFFWGMLFKDKPMQTVPAYLLMIPILLVAMLLFVGTAALLIYIRNRRVK